MTVSRSRAARHELSVALGWLSAFMGLASLIMIAGAAFGPEPAPVPAPAPSTIEGRTND
jgi:hypothetical protein